MLHILTCTGVCVYVCVYPCVCVCESVSVVAHHIRRTLQLGLGAENKGAVVRQALATCSGTSISNPMPYLVIKEI